MKPLYEQLLEAIREDIRKQVYKPGDRLPTETELEEIYGVSRITVRRAVKELCDHKSLMKKQGKGTFVLDRSFQSHLEGIGGFHEGIGGERQTETKLLKLSEQAAGAEMAGYLKISETDRVIVVKRVLSADQVPMMIDTCYIPSSRFPEMMDRLTGDFSIYRIFHEDYGISFATAEKVLKVRVATEEEGELLECKPGCPVFDIFKIVYDEHKVPVHVSVDITNGENTSYIISTDNTNHLKFKRERLGIQVIPQP